MTLPQAPPEASAETSAETSAEASAETSAEANGSRGSGRKSSLTGITNKVCRRTTRRNNSSACEMAPSSTTNAPETFPQAPESQRSNDTVIASSGASSHLIDKLLGRLKSLKRGPSPHSHGQPDAQNKSSTPLPPPQDDETFAEINVAVNPSNSPQPTESKTHEEHSPAKHLIDLAEYTNFCDELGKLLEKVQEVQELSTFTGTYPSTLQRRLDQDALELRSLYNQVREALHNIVRVKEQRRAVRKERNVAKKALVKIRDQEIREMEGLISQFDKALMNRWEKLKNTQQPELVENFLRDIKGKKQALEHMSTLVSQKLSQLSSAASGSATSERPSATTSSTLSGSGPPGFSAAALRDESKAGSSTATNRRNSVTGSGRTNGMRWRRHYERNIRSASSSSGPGSLPLSLVPLSLTPASAPSLGITIIPIAGASATTNSSESTPSSPSSSVIPPNTPIGQSQTEEDVLFHVPGTPGSLNLSGPACIPGGMIIGPSMPERRSMLQALFSDLRRSNEAASRTFVTLNHLSSSGASPSLGPVSTAVVVTAPEDSLRGSTTEQTANENGETNPDIELFSIDRPT